jgi:NAD(P)-dependent dehydrogenase (short-subunit alcohol dehydrogenase family)
MTDPVLNGSTVAHFPAGAAVVLGGSGGVGREVCGRLADHGTDVALTYRSSPQAAGEAVARVEAAGRRALAAPLDLTDAEAVAAFLTGVAAQLGRVHTVVFAIGGDISMSYATEVDPAEWRRVIDGELTGFFNVVQAALPQLRDGGGALVAVTSAGLVRHPPKDILSTAPKAGIEALVRAVAREEGRFGVRANTVALGVVETGLFHRAAARVGDEHVEAMRRNTAVRRLGTAREAADAIVFLASTVSGYTTGQRLTVDGGFSV